MKTYRILCIALIAAVRRPRCRCSPHRRPIPTSRFSSSFPSARAEVLTIEGRLLAKGMAKELGVPVVAINKPGAGGAVTYTFRQELQARRLHGGLELHFHPHLHEHRQRALGLHGARSHRAGALPAFDGGG